MSLYHEAASVLSADGADVAGGNLRSRVFNRKDLKSTPAQVYALALETCKWSAVLSEVIDHSQLLQHERKLSPMLSLLLVHDFLLAKGGIALPASHGLRSMIERHKSRLTAEFTRARIRRKCSSLHALTDLVEAAVYANSQHPRWIRINSLKSTLGDQLEGTFEGYDRVDSVQKVLKGTGKLIYVDEHIPNLVAVSPRFDFAKSAAYRSGAIILQDKASCFPAYLLDPTPLDHDIIDGCAAPGNKTTHLAAILKSHCANASEMHSSIHAFEKDAKRAKTLEKMVSIAGSNTFTDVHSGRDFLKVSPADQRFSSVGSILLDPSCSGSGIVGRDDMPELHLPTAPGTKTSNLSKVSMAAQSKKRKRTDRDPDSENLMIDDDGNTTVVTSEKDLQTRLDALSSFQLTLLLHAFRFPDAKKLTYSTCSVHADENEKVVMKALQSEIAQQRGWRILPRAAQVSGMKAWPVRGLVEACEGDEEVAEACIRAYKDDGRGVMGFFAAAFTRYVRTDTSVAVGRDTSKSAETEGKQKGRGKDSISERLPLPRNGHDETMSEYNDDESDWGGFDD